MISHLIKKAVDAGVFLFVEDQQLRFKLSVDEFPQALKTEILSRKPELIDFLSQQSQMIQKVYPKIGKQERSSAYLPLSFSQQRMWFIDEFQAGNSSNYNMSLALDVEGVFELVIAEQALQEIINRHEILRTNYQTSQDGPVQVVKEKYDFSLAKIDLIGLSSDEQNEQVKKRVDGDAIRAFDLRNDLMLRVSWLQLEDNRGILMFNIHHIASDGWSCGIIINEFTQLYSAYINGHSSSLLAMTIQYADYTLWQRQYLQGDILADQINYWSNQLSDAPSLHCLPLDFDRPEQPQLLADVVASTIPLNLSTQVNQLAISHQVTPFMVFHAVFSLVLARHSNVTNIVIGTPIANRPQKELENIIGFFVNTIALYSDSNQSDNFSDYLAHIKSVNLDAQDNQDLPFEQVVEQLKIPRSLQHNPLVQIMFSMDTNYSEEIALDNVSFKPVESNTVNAIFDLNLVAEVHDQGIDLFWNYDVALFKRETIKKLDQHFTHLLRSVLANPSAKLANLSMLSTNEESYLVNELNEIDNSYSNDKLIHQCFEEQAQRVPKRIAVVFEGQSFSYQLLNEKANQLACLLREQGVVCETLVGVYLERSVDMPLAILAILKAGGAYVPLDPNYPTDRLKYMLADSGLKHLITHEQLSNKLNLNNTFNVVTLGTTTTEKVMADKPITNLAPTQGQNLASLAYVIYTSGSTGQPKGVLQVHENATRLFLTTQKDFHFDENDTWTLFHSIAFDFSVWELWGALIYGGKLVIPSYDCTRDPEAFLALCQAQGVSILNQTPSAFNSFIKAALHTKAQLPLLRYVVFGGEALQVESLAPWWDAYGDAKPQLINMYGITETTVHVTYKVLQKDIQARSLIGHRLSDQRLYLFNQDQSLTPLGAIGEIYVGGAGLARGYLNQEQLTSERFIDNPFVTSERLYRTGDIARYVDHDELEFIGRVDDQVKIRGFRIELGEIEQQLLACENVGAGLVMVQTDSSGQKMLVAYAESRNDKSLDDDQKLVTKIRTKLQAHLPDYMIPAHFVMIKQWPTTPSGKIDKKALPMPDASIMQDEYTPANTATELTLCHIWQEVLSLEKVGVTDNFFSIGGDSIRALSVIAKGRNLGLSFSVKDLFINPHIGTLAKKIDELSTQSQTLEHLPAFSLLNDDEKALFVNDNIEDAYPLTVLQQGMIFHNLKEHESGSYHDVFGFKFQLAWQEASFKSVLTDLVRKHSSCRAVYVMDQPRPLQIIYKTLALPFEIIDLKGLDVAQQKDQIASWLAIEKNTAFDFSKPLWSITIHTLAIDEFYFSLSFHHAVWDGWSVASLETELFSAYQAMLAGKKLEQSPTPLSYAYFVDAEQKAISSAVGHDFWQEKLADVKLPWWSSTNRGISHTVDFNVSDERSSLLTAVAKTLGVQEKSLLLTIHMVLMRLLSGEEDVVSSVVVHGRPEAEHSEKTLGLFLNSLPFRLQSFDSTWYELILKVEQEQLAVIEHRHYPLIEIQKATQLDFSASLFNFIDFHVVNKVEDELDVVEIDGFEQTNYLFDADYSKDSSSGLFTISIKVDSVAFSESLRVKVVGYLDNIITNLLTVPKSKVDVQTLLGEQEIKQLLVDFNSPDIVYPGDACIHQRFENQVELFPDKIAVVHNGQSVSYRELNQKANRLAHHLRGIGITRNSLVGIFAQRSPEFLVAMLAIMKAGGAYVPLDPMNPKKRIDYMMTDAELCCLLTESQLLNQFTKDNDLKTKMAVICLDSLATEIDQSLVTNPMVINKADDLAYMIYTSGSTGQPKGALIHHGGALNHIDAEFDVLGFINPDKSLLPANFLQSAASSSDVSVWQFLAPVVSGGCTVILDDMTDMHTLLNLVQRYDVHLIETAPVVLQLLVDHVLTLDAQARELPSLRWLMTIAEATPVGLVNTWFSLYPNIPIMNGFGPSEASDDITYHIIRKPLADSVSNVPIGKPLANLTLYVLSENLQLQAIGVPGEICVSGIGVGLGYWNMPDKTAQSFVDNPFSEAFSVHGERIYRTGDLGRWSPNGELEFMGRIDNQVKVRGFRVELGEIEASLANIEGVGDVAVLVYQAENGENRLAAYLVLNQAHKKLSVAQIRSFLHESIPDYMIPSSFTFLDSMPLNAADKIDRMSLPAPKMDSALAAYVAPTTETETLLCEMWQNLLSVERVGSTDNFFQLGGHSLLAVQLISQLRKSLHIELPLDVLFSSYCLADLAQEVEQANATGFNEISVVDRKQPLPLSFAQQRLWFIDQIDKQGSAAYNMTGCLRLLGKLDERALNKAFERIIERHEVLRTRFVTIDGQARQIIDNSSTFSMENQALLGATTEEYMQVCEQDSAKPFNLEAGPLIRGKLLAIKEDQHILLVTMHHIVSDGWSIGIFSQELSSLYLAFSQGKPDPLTKLAIQYADFAQWQRQQSLTEQQDYWLKQLTGAPELLSLPIDRVRPDTQDYTGATLEVTLDKTLSQQLKILSEKHGVTLYMTLLAGWAALNSRLAVQDTVVIGSPNANRNRVELEALIGFFVNTQAMRVDFNRTLTVTELLAQVKTTALAAQRHQDIPFEQIVEALNPVRSMSHSPIFQIMFTWQNTPEDDLDIADLIIEGLDTEQALAQFDLSLDLFEEENQICGSLNYATALFDQTTIERHWHYFEALLRGMVADDLQAVATIKLLNAQEVNQVLTQFNDSDDEELISKTWLTLFAEQVKKTPLAIVADDGNNSISYCDLDTLSNNYAMGIRAKIDVNTPPNKDLIVAVLEHRNINLLVVMVAVLKSGAAYLPLDPKQPKNRWQTILTEAQPQLLLVGNELVDEYLWLKEEWQHDKVCTFSQALALQDSVQRHSWATPSLDDLAYIIYTSGSTGKPKGVMIEHRGMINNICSKFLPLTLDAQDVIAQTASQCFDISVWQFLTAPLLGAKVQIINDELIRDPQQLLEEISVQKVTIWEPVPSMLQAVLTTTNHLPDLRWVLPTGEALTTGLVRNWFASYPDIPLMNAYGPAECSDDVAFEPIHEVVDRIYIGRPIANARLHVVDDEMNLSPQGVVGELAISGPVVGRGYLNRTELTEEVFKNNPFCQHRLDERIYLSGDLVRRHQDGRIEYIGRKDHQVKIRGFRIELGEIEQALVGYDQVNEALVLAINDSHNNKFLVAYLVLESRETSPLLQENDIAGIKKALKNNLPDYMMPRVMMVIDKFPLTVNGKIDRKSLPEPNLSELTVSYIAPSNHIEKQLCEIWQDLLGLELVGVNDDFFVLGGHSLLAVQVISHLRNRLAVELPLTAIFNQPKLVDLAYVISQLANTDIAPLEHANRDLPISLSYAQQRLWFIDQLDKEASAAYHMPDGLRLKGQLDQVALIAALDRIIARHEILRTRFLSTGDSAEQLIESTSGFSLIHQDLQGATEDEYQQICEQESSQPFDLEKGPLIRGRLLTMAPDDHVLLLTMHHIISDGWSFGVITHEISTLYEAFSQDKVDPLPALAFQYADFSLWQKQQLQGPKLQKQLNYWLEKLQGSPELVSLPTDRVRPEKQDYTGASIDVMLDIDLSRDLKALSQKHGTTLYVTFLAAWAGVVSRLAGQDDVVIGSPNANRTRIEFESLIGFLVNTQAMRINLNVDLTVAELLTQVKATTLGAFNHQDIQFEQVVEAVNPLRSTAHSPIFQLMFIWDNTPEEKLAMAGLEIENVDAAESSAQFDLSLSLVEDGEQIMGRLSYACALFDQQTIKNHWGYLKAMLVAMVANDKNIVGQIPLLNTEQHEQVVYEFNGVAQDYSSVDFVHQLFEQQAQKNPEAIAIDFEGQQLTYAVLNEKVNQLAYYLIDSGIKPDDRIAICTQRSIEMVVAILASLKAGGAYVPIDSDHPKDRIAHMLQDSAAKIVLLQKQLTDKLPLSNDYKVIVLDETRWEEAPWGDNCKDNCCIENLGLTKNNLAYVIYTSGSTGLPKGVMIEHLSIVNRVQWMQQNYPLMLGESTLQKTPFSFDVSVPEFFWPLAFGAKIVVARPDGHKDPIYLANLIAEKSITTVSFVPSMLQVFVADKPSCYSLKRVLCAGEALSDSLIDESKALWPHAKIHNLYGPTEATVYATALTYDDATEPQGSIGQPLGNTQIYILDKYLNPVPVGVAGEMYIGGVGVARGYLNNPILTENTFLPDPFSPKDGARIYKTGDLAAWQSKGAVTYLGRNDFQVKVRGFRIELGEIENQLTKVEGVDKSAVIAQIDALGNTGLIAYIVGDNEDSPRTLRAQLNEHLPEYMLPSAYVFLPSLPITTNGKLDRSALPLPDDSAYVKSVYEEPQGEIEETLAKIWSQLLNVEHVGRLDNFFELGGHSLMAVQLISQIRHQLKIELPIADVFVNATLLDLAKNLGISELVLENKLMTESESLEELEW
ncbi:MAG: amino acid adenylation domain-containing protein [Alteromonadaceae bacterium]|jgi:amino acid adenylation domain-containing protein